MLRSGDEQLFTDVSGQRIGPIVKGQVFLNCFTLKTGSIVCPETSLTTYQGCVPTKKNEDLIYTAAEAWNHALPELLM
jgi:hypothetical protein